MENEERKLFENYLLARGYNEKTIRRKLAHIARFCKWLSSKNYEVLDLDYQKCLNYLAWERSNNIAEKTLRHYLTHVRNYYDYLVEKQQLQENPFSLIQLKTKLKSSAVLHLQDLLKPADLSKIYEVYRANRRLNARDKILLGLLIYQGIAVAELSHLQIKNVDLENALLHVPSSKTYAARTLDLAAPQILSLSKFIQSKLPEEKLIAYKSESQGVNARTHLCDQIRRELKKHQLKISFRNLRQIRRSVLVEWVRVHNLRQAQYLAGHRWVHSTERYQVQEITELIGEVNKYHPLRTVNKANDKDD